MVSLLRGLLVLTVLSSALNLRLDLEGMHYINELPDLNAQPVFAILAQPLEYVDLPIDSNATDYIASSYVKFLEMSGARVVPITLNSTYAEINAILSKVNGVMFTGGEAPFWEASSQFPALAAGEADLGCYIFEQVKKINDLGTFFPLWATCLGFELIHVCANNEFETIGNFDGTPPYINTNEFTRSAATSAIFTYRSPIIGHQMMEIFKRKKVAVLNHRFGISPQAYETFASLRETFEILSTMHDLSGNPFVAMVQGKKYPIFGTQFHPEKNLFEFLNSVFPHDNDAIISASYLSNFIVSLGRKNNNTFPIEELNQQLIYNYPPIFIHAGFETVSVFP